MTYTPSENIPNPNNYILHNSASTKFGVRNKKWTYSMGENEIYYLVLSLELQIHFICETNGAAKILSSVLDRQLLMWNNHNDIGNSQFLYSCANEIQIQK